MSGLYLSWGMALSGIYVLWTVREQNFFFYEDHLEHVERSLVQIFAKPAAERQEAWSALLKEDAELRAIVGTDSHLAEVIKHLKIA